MGKSRLGGGGEGMGWERWSGRGGEAEVERQGVRGGGRGAAGEYLSGWLAGWYWHHKRLGQLIYPLKGKAKVVAGESKSVLSTYVLC